MKLFLSVFLVVLIMSSVYDKAYGQTVNENQILNEQYPNTLGCGLVKITSTQAYLPYSIKISHDPQSQINVTTSASAGSQVITDGTNTSLFVVYTNSTDTNIGVHASVDYKTAFDSSTQHTVSVEYWSAGNLDHIEKNVLTSSHWCEDFQLSTVLKPTPPNIPKLVEDAVKNLYDKTLAVVDANTKASISNAFLSWITVMLLIGIMGFQGLSRLRGRKRKKGNEKAFEETVKNAMLSIVNTQISMKHMETMMEMNFGIIVKEVREKMLGMIAEFTIGMNSALLELRKTGSKIIDTKAETTTEEQKEKEEPIVIQPDPITDIVKTDVTDKVEDTKVEEKAEEEPEFICEECTFKTSDGDKILAHGSEFSHRINLGKHTRVEPKEIQTEMIEDSFADAMSSAENTSIFDKIKSRIPFKKTDVDDKLTDSEKDELVIKQYITDYYNVKKDGKLDVEKLQNMYDEWHKEYKSSKTIESARRIKALYRVLYGVI